MLALVFFLQVMRRHRVKTEIFTVGYPMRYSGGVFLVCVGLGIIAGGLWHGGQALALFFVVSAGIGFVLLIRTRRLVAPIWGTPSPRQTRFMLAAIGSEFALFFLLGASGFFQHQSAAMVWETALGIVGLHFLIMRGSHGPLMTWLALSVLAWLGVGHLLHLSLQVTAVGDGLLKLGFGGIMARPLLPALQSASRLRTSDGVAPLSRNEASVTD